MRENLNEKFKQIALNLARVTPHQIFQRHIAKVGLAKRDYALLCILERFPKSPCPYLCFIIYLNIQLILLQSRHYYLREEKTHSSQSFYPFHKNVLPASTWWRHVDIVTNVTCYYIILVPLFYGPKIFYFYYRRK